MRELSRRESVRLRHKGNRERPRDAKVGTQRIEPSLPLGIVGISVQVEQPHVVCQCLEAVRAARGYHNGLGCFTGQHEGIPAAKGWGCVSQVNYDIKDHALKAGDQFPFPRWG